jgi:hypothetical protein
MPHLPVSQRVALRGRAACQVGVARDLLCLAPTDRVSFKRGDSGSLDQKALREFDLNARFGPCVGVTRLQRWERAQAFDLDPPAHVQALILAHPGDTAYEQCLWNDAL